LAEPGDSLGQLARVVCDLRLGCIVLLLLTEGMPSASWAQWAIALAPIPLSYLPVRRWEPAGRLLMATWWFPALDALTCVLLLVAFGVGSSALVYVGASAFLLALANGRRGATMLLLPIVALHVASGVSLLLSPQLDSPALGGLTGRLLLILAAGAMGLRVSRLFRARDALEVAVSRSEIERAQAEERTRLAQEMHDSLSKTIHGMHLLATVLARRLREDGSRRADMAEALASAAADARDDGRRLLGDLRRAVPEDVASELRALATSWGSAHPETEVDVEVPGHDLGLGLGVRYEVLRSAGELLENVSRHAHATKVRVTARERDGWLELTIADNGRGMPPPDLAALHDDGHYGLVGIHERMRRVNGEVRMERPVGGGAQVMLRLPLALAGPDAHEARGADQASLF
jgi:signal transduction histidine kinase